MINVIPQDKLLKYKAYGKKFDKSIKVVNENGVKCHRFLPSKRELWTVVGTEGDYYVDDSQNFCSCEHFYFKVLRGKDELCYHLLSLRIAKECSMFETIEFGDMGYSSFLENLLKDMIKKK
ncbi:MAG: hypothetical protein MUO21_02005 [Nitrososphaeraceae archaeon]|nr:hypothetical protein [Nitrososphaeraceae archaeon]